MKKLAKAKIVESLDQSPPPTHNIVILIKKIGLDVSKEDKKELREINGFNLNARYDTYKFEFYKKATLEYTTKWKKIIEKWITTLKKK